MKVLILSSSSNEIDSYYLSVARGVSYFFLSNGCELVFGGSPNSMMGTCYDEFITKGGNAEAHTIKKYAEDLKTLGIKEDYHNIYETTFDLKKNMFKSCDFVVVLPGGIGTVSEMFSYIEENRTNDANVPIIVYDETNFYGEIFKFIEKLNIEKFTKETDLSNIYFANNKQSLEDSYYKVVRKLVVEEELKKFKQK